jgi:hypothetical protein
MRGQTERVSWAGLYIAGRTHTRKKEHPSTGPSYGMPAAARTIGMAIEVKKVANHELIHEDEDFFVYRFGPGAITGEQMEILSELERRSWDRPYIFDLIVFDEQTSIPPGTLTHVAKLFRHSPPRTSSFVVKSFFLRTSMEFLVRTTRLLGVKVEAGFFENEQSARIWVGEKRRDRK